MLDYYAILKGHRNNLNDSLLIKARLYPECWQSRQQSRQQSDDRGPRLLIRNAVAGQHFFQGSEFFVEEFQDADEVAGIAYVHGVGQCGYGLPGMILACLQEIGHHGIGVAGRDKMPDGEA